ncbi:UNVERIFIED_CONTAM: Ubiquitin-like-specific protease 1A, partial [Sesamum radiatum]
ANTGVKWSLAKEKQGREDREMKSCTKEGEKNGKEYLKENLLVFVELFCIDLQKIAGKSSVDQGVIFHARYYVDEVKDKSGEDINVSSWEEEFVANIPDQKNGFDCGMFMIKYADFYSRDIGLCFNQGNMAYFRRRTAKEILKLRAE